MKNRIGVFLVRLIPPCFRRFPDGCSYVIEGGKVMRRLYPWKSCPASMKDFLGHYANYWRSLPVMVDPPGRNWWWRWRPSR